MGNTMSYVRDAINKDHEIRTIYFDIAEKKGVPGIEAVEDFARLIAIRVDYERMGDMWLIERWMEGINHIDLGVFNKQMKLIQTKYGLSYHYTYSIVNRLVSEVKINLDRPFAVIWDNVRPYLKSVGVGILGKYFGGITQQALGWIFGPPTNLLTQ